MEHMFYSVKLTPLEMTCSTVQPSRSHMCNRKRKTPTKSCFHSMVNVPLSKKSIINALNKVELPSIARSGIMLAPFIYSDSLLATPLTEKMIPFVNSETESCLFVC